MQDSTFFGIFYFISNTLSTQVRFTAQNQVFSQIGKLQIKYLLRLLKSQLASKNTIAKFLLLNGD